MTKEEIGCAMMFRHKMNTIGKQFKLGRDMAKELFWAVKPRTKSEQDYDAFMKEPIRTSKLGKVTRRVKLWTWECSI